MEVALWAAVLAVGMGALAAMVVAAPVTEVRAGWAARPVAVERPAAAAAATAARAHPEESCT